MLTSLLNIEVLLQCPLCGNLLRKARTISECGHSFCEHCIAGRLGEQGACPKCKQPAYVKHLRHDHLHDALVKDVKWLKHAFRSHLALVTDPSMPSNDLPSLPMASSQNPLPSLPPSIDPLSYDNISSSMHHDSNAFEPAPSTPLSPTFSSPPSQHARQSSASSAGTMPAAPAHASFHLDLASNLAPTSQTSLISIKSESDHVFELSFDSNGNIHGATMNMTLESEAQQASAPPSLGPDHSAQPQQPSPHLDIPNNAPATLIQAKTASTQALPASLASPVANSPTLPLNEPNSPRISSPTPSMSSSQRLPTLARTISAPVRSQSPQQLSRSVSFEVSDLLSAMEVEDVIMDDSDDDDTMPPPQNKPIPAEKPAPASPHPPKPCAAPPPPVPPPGDKPIFAQPRPVTPSLQKRLSDQEEHAEQVARPQKQLRAADKEETAIGPWKCPHCRFVNHGAIGQPCGICRQVVSADQVLAGASLTLDPSMSSVLPTIPNINNTFVIESTLSVDLPPQDIHDRTRHKIMVTTLSPDDMDFLHIFNADPEFANGLSVYVYDDATRDMDFVTHVITSTDDRRLCKRADKYLRAILTGKWIVSMQWLRASREAGYWLPEQEYEVLGDTMSGVTHGPQRGRERLAKHDAPFFTDRVRFYFDNFTDLDDHQHAIAKRGGGRSSKKAKLASDEPMPSQLPPPTPNDQDIPVPAPAPTIMERKKTLMRLVQAGGAAVLAKHLMPPKRDAHTYRTIVIHPHKIPPSNKGSAAWKQHVQVRDDTWLLEQISHCRPI
ncbi:hypothetical protein BC940DRAFT_328662 [Gongronella butleri]|nr:hypothetical protein BC940DRAFT_328662 [Gongronella butleri]